VCGAEKEKEKEREKECCSTLSFSIPLSRMGDLQASRQKKPTRAKITCARARRKLDEDYKVAFLRGSASFSLHTGPIHLTQQTAQR
jgi:hypothetical protein